MEAPLLDPDVAPVEDRRDRRGVGRRPADPVLLERLDQRRLGEARRRLREVLGRGDVADGRDVALGEGGQAALRLLVVAVVAALRVDRREPVEERLRRARPELVRAVGELDRRRLELLGRHLRGDGPLPDQAVEAELVRGQETGQRIRIAPERGRPDRLVGLLGALRLRPVDPALGHRVRLAEAVADHVPRLAHRHAGDRGRVRPHVGDERRHGRPACRRPRTAAGRPTSSASG